MHFCIHVVEIVCIYCIFVYMGLRIGWWCLFANADGIMPVSWSNGPPKKNPQIIVCILSLPTSTIDNKSTAEAWCQISSAFEQAHSRGRFIMLHAQPPDTKLINHYSASTTTTQLQYSGNEMSALISRRAAAADSSCYMHSHPDTKLIDYYPALVNARDVNVNEQARSRSRFASTTAHNCNTAEARCQR